MNLLASLRTAIALAATAASDRLLAQKMTAAVNPLPPVPIHTNPQRRMERAALAEVGVRQYKKANKAANRAIARTIAERPVPITD